MQVQLIPSKRRRRKKRVAAYCRVSTDRNDQEESFETQQAYYRSYIRSQSEWEYAGIYSDEKSGLKAKNRPGFCAMVEDALAEKIDLILVKSVSRLSRNVVDCIDVAKTLGSHGVGIYFEKEGILSTDPASGMILNLMAAVAQDESRSISDNVKWANRERVKRGEYRLGNNRVLGYDDVDGKLIPNADADIIRTIFRLFLEGKSYRQIAAHLKNTGATGLRGADIHPAGIQYILRNEIYVGDRLLQKRAPRNLLTKQPEKNVEYESNYLQNDQEEIINRKTWEAVQEILDRRASQTASGMGCSHRNTHPMYGKIICAQCGSPYTRKTYQGYGDKGNYHAWICSGKRKGSKCASRGIREEALMREIQEQMRWNSDEMAIDDILKVEVGNQEVVVHRK